MSDWTERDTTTEPRWPFPQDTPLQIARQVARAYRECLNSADTKLCATVDARMAGFGQKWMLDVEALRQDGDLVTTREAAELAGVTEAKIRQWAAVMHPCVAGKRLLPHGPKRGRERTYVAADVLAAARTAEAYPLTRVRRDPTRLAAA